MRAADKALREMQLRQALARRRVRGHLRLLPSGSRTLVLAYQRLRNRPPAAR